ncbi:MAG TPA: hypothetical protein VGM14_14485 [Streptosporangiaceae bacterium]|jgi:hypothetical protein
MAARFGGQAEPDRIFEVAVIHHTQRWTGFLSDPGFLRQAAEAAGPVSIVRTPRPTF